VRLEPTLVGGFNQALRTLIPESVTGTVDASRDNRLNLGFEQKLGSGTYLAVEANDLTAKVDRSFGIFHETLDPFTGLPDSITPADTTQTLRYKEKSLLFTANQLLGAGWSLGAIYTVNKAELEQALPDVVDAAIRGDRVTVRHGVNFSNSAVLQRTRLFVLYNDPTGFFARAETLWAAQDNDGYPHRGAVVNIQGKSVRLVSEINGADFWQVNFFVGYRLARNLGDITIGFLDVTNRDYRLNPLNVYSELPRSFTISVQTRLNF
jgi:hypothetical protein